MWIPATAAAVLLLVVAPQAFGSGNVAMMMVWLMAAAMYAVALVDIARSDTPPVRGRLWRDVLVVSVCGVLAGLAAAGIWAWVSSRVDSCPPGAPFGGCGGERVVLGFLWPVPIFVVAVVLAVLRVSRAAVAGFGAVPVTTLIVMIYNTRLPGTPVPSPWLLAGLAVAGFLLAWAAGAKQISPWVRLIPATVTLGLVPLAAYLGA